MITVWSVKTYKAFVKMQKAVIVSQKICDSSIRHKVIRNSLVKLSLNIYTL